MKRHQSAQLRGFTLIEVVAALGILGVLLTAASVSQSRMAEQDRQSRDRLLAVGLLASWADQHWSKRDQWAAWAEGGEAGELPPLLETKFASADDSRRTESWRLLVRFGPRLEPPVPEVVSLRLVVVGSDVQRGASPLALLDVLVPEVQEEGQAPDFVQPPAVRGIRP